MITKNKTQIRDSHIEALKERVKKQQYEHYLREIRIEKLRGLEDCAIRFDFPVTAIVGPNGSGKSTIVGAAGLICKQLKPRTFFSRAGKYDDSMKGWTVSYSCLVPDDKSLNKPKTTTATFRQAKWNRDAIARPVRYIGIERTIPAAERRNLSKFASGKFKSDKEQALSPETRRNVAKILGKEADNYIRVFEAENSPSEKSIFAAAPREHATPEGDTSSGENLRKNPAYSEFHFGAGEASIISIVDEIEQAPKFSLILIEEIENGLHPVATFRLIEYLMDVAKRKSSQIIFTTHSNNAIEPLPDDAVWSVGRGKLYQGKLDVESLRALVGEIDTKCAIFTEDEFTKRFAEVTLRKFHHPGSKSPRIVDMKGLEIHALGGESQVREHTQHHNSNPTIKFPVVGLLDGDQRDAASKTAETAEWTNDGEVRTFNQIVYCPGDGHPEQVIYEDIIRAMAGEDGRTDPTAKLTVSLGEDSGRQEHVRSHVEEIYHSNHDPHLLFARLGEKLGFLSAHKVEDAFFDQWCASYPDRLEEMWRDAANVLPFIELED
ncbi:ATP-dependent nuclease [Corynebacterium sphenisci]|uniref:ATP-dependent nuclease n=1 Tax=Corynebacterium sphenisci TaxID=191493 RepID=UPI000952080A|nr:AAA family ATPase [Corynebacterium sphenisci]